MDHRDAYDPKALSLLNQLRFQAVSCRAAKHLSFDEACRQIHSNVTIEVEERLAALIRIIDQAIDGRAVIHAPRCASLSFDEKWLLQIFEQVIQEDQDSVNFLVRSRVSRYKQRSFISLCILVVQAHVQNINSRQIL